MEGQGDDGWVPVGQTRGCAWRERARGQRTTNPPVGSGNAETATASALGHGRSAPTPGSATAPGGSAVAGQFAAAPEPVAAESVASAWGTSAPSREGGVRGAAQSASVASQPQGVEVPVSEPSVCNPLSPQAVLQFEAEASRQQRRPNLVRLVGLPQASMPCKFKLWPERWLLPLQKLSQKAPLMQRSPSQPVPLLRNPLER